MDDVVAKPIDLRRLIDAIDASLSPPAATDAAKAAAAG